MSDAAPQRRPRCPWRDRAGLSSRAIANFTLSTDDWRNPLVHILTSRPHASYAAVPASLQERRRRPNTPFEDGAFHVIALRGARSSDDASGLLIFSGPRRITPDLEWFASVIAQKLAQVLRRLALSEGDRRQEYERSLLRTIVNAVTDPILMTDTDGRMLVANARARALFVELGGAQRRTAWRGRHEQHAAVLRAVEQGDRGSGRDAARAAARQPDRRIGSAVRAAEHDAPRTPGTAPASCRFCGTSATSAAPPSRSTKAIGRCDRPKCR